MEEFRKQQRARRRGDGGVARRAADEPVVYRPPERPTSRRRPVTCRTESRPLRYAERGAEPRHVPKDACENEAVRPRRRDGHERRDAHGTAAPRRRTRRRKRDVFHEVDEFSDAAPAPDERAARAAAGQVADEQVDGQATRRDGGRFQAKLVDALRKGGGKD